MGYVHRQHHAALAWDSAPPGTSSSVRCGIALSGAAASYRSAITPSPATPDGE